MKELIKKKVYIGIKKNEHLLHFTAIINSITNKHVSFTDKYGKNYCFLLDDIYEIYEKDEDESLEKKEWKYDEN